jgi:hypothetical protein
VQKINNRLRPKPVPELPDTIRTSQLPPGAASFLALAVALSGVVENHETLEDDVVIPIPHKRIRELLAWERRRGALDLGLDFLVGAENRCPKPL